MKPIYSVSLLCLILMGNISLAVAQQHDTIVVDGSKVQTRYLQPGVNRYLVYFKMGKDSSRIDFQFWSRKVDFLSYQGREAIGITQEWEDNKTIVHKVYSVCDKKTFAPLLHESWWASRGTTKADFISKQFFMQDTLLSNTDTARLKKNILQAFHAALDQNVLNWHLDLETFPILPYKDNVTFMINFYDPGFPAPKLQAYTVSGSAQLEGVNNQKIDCWLLKHGSPNNNETFWISKKTHEVLKLEQQFGSKYRYKIKLGYSI
ncbi:hypothetical protein [Paraflavitalea sp. CAU 1676]|uniref:DUF3108 domain-containing protein n=1 Tax=Paraflavitalea sp. CAU 1676 TaxID=3032598 RepID=UPI0023DAE1E6|nr:hypothetical protein [Paraflavitalea sp. CAU 1676]MDF2187374.1 hypothetical protein [Paraflavitalea sp. CAU 1676]